MPYRDPRLALVALITRLSADRARVDRELTVAKARLKELTPRRRALAPVAIRDIETIQAGVDLSMVVDPKRCPQVADLIARGYLATGKNTADPYGAPYRISCVGRIRVSSAGPDGEHGTEDDIVGR